MRRSSLPGALLLCACTAVVLVEAGGGGTIRRSLAGGGTVSVCVRLSGRDAGDTRVLAAPGGTCTGRELQLELPAVRPERPVGLAGPRTVIAFGSQPRPAGLLGPFGRAGMARESLAAAAG